MSGATSIDSPINRRIVAALEQHGPMTVREIADKAAASFQTLRGGSRYTAALHKAGRIHVVRWIRSCDLDPPRSGAPAPVYAAGPGKDAPKPRPLTKSTINRRYYATAKGRLAAQRAHIKKQGVAAVDQLLAALMGTHTTAARVAAEGAEA